MYIYLQILFNFTKFLIMRTQVKRLVRQNLHSEEFKSDHSAVLSTTVRKRNLVISRDQAPLKRLATFSI